MELRRERLVSGYVSRVGLPLQNFARGLMSENIVLQLVQVLRKCTMYYVIYHSFHCLGMILGGTYIEKAGKMSSNEFVYFLPKSVVLFM